MARSVQPRVGGLLRVGSVCSGLGSEGLALDLLGLPYSMEFAADNNPDCRTWLRERHPALPRLYRDICSEEFSGAPPCDLFVGGFPCQPYSSQGVGAGYGDNRSGPVLEAILSYVERERPRCILLENVVGLAHRHRSVLEYLFGRLESLGGYTIKYSVLNAKAHGGLPQNRPRLFICAYIPGSHCPPFSWPEPVSCPPEGERDSKRWGEGREGQGGGA